MSGKPNLNNISNSFKINGVNSVLVYEFQFSFKVVLNFLHSDLIIMFTVIFVLIIMYVT